MPAQPHCRRRHLRFGTRTASTFTPPGVAARYGLPRFTATGTAPLIALIELGGGYRLADFQQAFQSWGLPLPSITDLSVSGAVNRPGDDADAEVVLDGQVAAAVYSYQTGQAARLLYVFAPNTGAGFAAAIAAAVQAGAAVLGISWGAPEDLWTADDRQQLEAALALAAAAGVTAFVASGDNDANDTESVPTTDYPAASPHAVGCGGTNLTVSGETVWNDGSDGSGGGSSKLFGRPAWQTTSGSARGVPDVAGDADPATGYDIVLNGTVQTIGGTSAVAPLWAGIAAAALAGGGTRQFLGPLLYQHAALFHDITSGDNGAYQATAGWDACTGLGTPTAALFAALVGTPTPPPVPVPVPVPTPTPTPILPSAAQWNAECARLLKAYARRPLYTQALHLAQQLGAADLAAAGHAAPPAPALSLATILQLILAFGPGVLALLNQYGPGLLQILQTLLPPPVVPPATPAA